jgi:hypothetical protein
VLLVTDAPAAHAVDIEHDFVERLLRDRGRSIPLPLCFLNDHLELASQLTGVD